MSEILNCSKKFFESIRKISRVQDDIFLNY